MTKKSKAVNMAPAGGAQEPVAPLTNMFLAARAIDTAIHREPGLPGIVVFYGPSGYGKSIAAAYTAATVNAVHVTARSTWSQRALLEEIAHDLGNPDPARTLAKLTQQAGDDLAAARRPLIIDEMDHIVNKRFVEVIRDLYEMSKAPTLLIGEEAMPAKLKEWERFDNRILDFIQAQPASIEDAMKLRDLYCTKIALADDLLQHFLDQTHGVTRRLVVNLARARAAALEDGAMVIDRAWWGARPVFTGQPPRRARLGDA